MTTVALADLLTAPSSSTWRDTLLGFLSAANFPVTSWADPGTARALVEMEADALADVSLLVPQIAAGGFLDYATGPWLVLLAKSVYDVDQKGAVTLVGTEVLANSTGAPININPGDLTFQSLSGLQYRNAGAATVPAGGTVAIPINAAAPGSVYNVGNGEITTLLTPIPGLSCSNPAVGTTGTWITTQGVDVESDVALRLRCRAKWGALGTGGNGDAYLFWATTSSPSVTRVSVQENTPLAGQVTCLVAGPAGAIVDSTVMATVDAYVQARRPLCVRVFTTSASNVVQVLQGTITVKAAYLAAAQAGAAKALAALFAAYPIGAKITVSDLVQAFASQPGVTDVVLLNPSTGLPMKLGTDDVALGATQIATYTNAVTWTAV